MTQQKKVKMLQIFGGSIAAVLIAILTFSFSFGGKLEGQSRNIQFNTERIRQNAHVFEEGMNSLKGDMKALKTKNDEIMNFLLNQRYKSNGSRKQ